ncbi:MAG TPA: hypothetical protein VHD84_02680, partial [Candidatus Saccharimonadales bacterium]|nr:hypothetical protein [Candidatus Saccharimonadales bacterium]
TFVILYLIVRYTAQRRLTQDDYMANVLDLLKDASIKDLDLHEYQRAKQLLAHVSPDHTLYEPTRMMLERVKPQPDARPSWLSRIISGWRRPLQALSRRPFFPRLIISIAAIYGVALMIAAIFFFAGATWASLRGFSAFLKGDESDWIGGASAMVSAICIAIAALKYQSRRLSSAYKFFEFGLLVNIFIGQVVLFFKNENIALIWLAVTLLLLVNLEILTGENANQRAGKRPN